MSYFHFSYANLTHHLGHPVTNPVAGEAPVDEVEDDQQYHPVSHHQLTIILNRAVQIKVGLECKLLVEMW